MKIRSFKVYAFEKKGFILEMQDETGRISYGETSPLVGRSPESKQEALFALFKLQEQFIHASFSPFPLPPSVSFGMESVLTAVQSPLTTPISLPYTALSYGREIDTPCSQVKLKTTDLTWKETILLVETFLKKGKRLILDFNMRWTKEEILALRKEFSPVDFDGLEDPTHSIDDLEELYSETGFPFHIDELFSLKTFVPSPAIHTIVIKPTLIGNSLTIRNIQKLGIPIRLTSAMETGVGLIHIMRLAYTLEIKTPIGIDTPFEPLIEVPFQREEDHLILDPETYNNMPVQKNLLVSCQPSLV